MLSGEPGGIFGQVIGEHIEVRTAWGASIWPVNMDPGQLDQILLNVILNAHDAMPDGGTLTVETANVSWEPVGSPLHQQPAPGPYVRLRLTDTGCGMSPEVQGKIFEPFFTTKGPGRGTGLGLATVYGIVMQNGGGIEVESEVGRGTTISVYLPQGAEAGIAGESADGAAFVPRGSGTIVVVEDESLVRAYICDLLTEHGYRVLEAAEGVEALRHVAHEGQAIRLVLSDVVMPGMNGRQLAERLRSDRPDLPVLLMTGYVDDELIRRGPDAGGWRILQKPFGTPEALLHAIREALDAAPSAKT